MLELIREYQWLSKNTRSASLQEKLLHNLPDGRKTSAVFLGLLLAREPESLSDHGLVS